MTRADNARETRNRILTAARGQFDQHGYDGPTIRSIAAQAGVAAGTVILHFGDKRGLLAAALEDQVEAALDEIAGLNATMDLPTHGRLARLAAPLFRRYCARPVLARVLVAEGLFAEAEWQRRQDGQIARFRQLAAACAGLAADDARLDLFMAAYVLVLVGMLRQPQPEAAAAELMLGRLLAAIEGFA